MLLPGTSLSLLSGGEGKTREAGREEVGRKE